MFAARSDGASECNEHIYAAAIFAITYSIRDNLSTRREGQNYIDLFVNVTESVLKN